MTFLEEIQAKLGALPETDRKEIIEAAQAATSHMKWIPNPGPQTDAFFSPADVLLYGGQGGGGKSDLGLGLAFTEHRRSLILRRKYANLGALTERAIEINESRNGYNGSPPPLLRTADGRYIQFAGNQHLGDEQDWQGQPFDLKVFDEATQFLELQIRFHLGWLRSTDPGQRCRAILGTNPPISADGDFIIGMFRPWLDLTHPNPAKHGELRYYVVVEDGTDLEVPVTDLTRDAQGRWQHKELATNEGKPRLATSRSFIPAKLSDNPYLARTDYASRLDALPEPIRSAVRDGNFMAARSDADYQVIPTQWIIEAQARWKEDGWKNWNQSAMGLDPAGGGKDSEVLTWRHACWYAPPVVTQGEKTGTPQGATLNIFGNRRDNAPVIVDVGGGYASGIQVRLTDNNVPMIAFNGADEGIGRTKDSNIPFANRRAEAWWRFREVLDPNQPGGSQIMLPPDPELRSDLAAPCYMPNALEKSGVVQIESKQEIRKRLGRSPDRGDAVVMCHWGGNIAVRRNLQGAHDRGSNRPTFATTKSSPYKSRRR